MKKVLFICTIAASALFVACEGNVKTEDVGVGVNKGLEAIEAMAADSTAAKDSTLACTCEHGCKTKEDCIKNCGEGCAMLKE